MNSRNTDVVQRSLNTLTFKTLSLELETADWNRRAGAIARLLKAEI